MIAPRFFLERVRASTIVLFSLPAGTAAADPVSGPLSGPFSGEVTVEFQNDWAAHSEDPAVEGNDAFLTVEAALAAQIAEGLGPMRTSRSSRRATARPAGIASSRTMASMPKGSI